MGADENDDLRVTGNCAVIRDYLRSEFADIPVETLDERRGGLTFRIPWLGLASLWFSDQFLEDTEPHDTAAFLHRNKISAWMTRVMRGHLLGITNDGVTELPEK